MRQITKNRTKSRLSLFLTFLFLSLFGSFSFASDCDNLEVNSALSTIAISGLTAPVEIIKVYDANWQIIFECSADCKDDILLSGLDIGEYHVELQAFDADWNGLCDTTIDVSIEGCFCPAVYMPVCGVDGKTYGNSCEAACAGVEVVQEGACAPMTTCELLTRILLNPDLCEQCLTEIAVYSLEGKSFLVYLANNITCADGLTRVVDCDTGEDFCLEGGIAGFSCGDFFDNATKVETILEEDCSPCICTTEYAPVCGADGKTYSNRCKAECAGVEIVKDGECSTITTCDLLAQITLNPDLCEQCLSEIAVYSLEGKSFLVYLANNITCADGLTRVVDCDTGEDFCLEGGIAGFSCGDFFDNATKVETILEEDCSPCICTTEYAPVCGADGKTYSNRCKAECAGVEIVKDGECATITTCDLLAQITLNPDLCEQCLSEIAVYSLEGKSFLVYLANNITCADGLTRVVDCDTGEDFCLEGGIAGFSCGDFFDNATKVETILEEDCSPCVCTQEYVPVCGADGKTYSNACQAACAGVEVVQEGECPCICPDIYAPVCGADGKTYGNDCEAECAGVEIVKDGECSTITTCDLLAGITLNPDLCEQCLSEIAVYSLEGKSFLVYLANNITCADGLTRVVDCDTGEDFCLEGGIAGFNQCEDFFEKAEKIETILEEDCTPCFCTKEYVPVCGADGKTYGNRCEAECAGVDIISEGECNTKEACDILALVDLNPDLCGQCLSEIALYSFQGNNYLVFLADNFNCADALTTVISCESGEEFCRDGGFAGFTECEKFFEEAVKIQTILISECNECKGLPTPGVPCPENYDPVCGCDGATYSNECVAQSNGVKKWTQGECQLPESIKCGDITISYGNGKIKMTGQPEQEYFFKIHDRNDNWKEVFDCTTNCGWEQTASLPYGKYYIKIYNSKWERVCEQAITLVDVNAPSEGRFQCDDAVVTYNNGKVVLTGAADKSYHLKIIDEDYNDAFACMWQCGNIIEATDIATGHYLVRVLDANYEQLCEEMINLTNDADDRSIALLNFSVYPNPAQKEVFINLTALAKKQGDIQIVNTYGQVITKQTFDNQDNPLLKIDVSTYQNGIYYYQIKLPALPIVSGKFIVNRIY